MVQTLEGISGEVYKAIVIRNFSDRWEASPTPLVMSWRIRPTLPMLLKRDFGLRFIDSIGGYKKQ
jgi:hypothetical protein